MEIPMSFADLEDKIFPLIKATLPATGSGPGDGMRDGTDAVVCADPVTMDFMADLVLTFAVDDGECFSPLQWADVPEGMDADAVYALGKKNLTEQVEFTLSGTSYGGYGILAGGDHEAAALCLPFIWDAVATQAGTDLVVAVPARDCLFMAVASDPDQVEAMKTIAKDIFENGERVLTRTLFLFSVTTRNFSVYGQF